MHAAFACGNTQEAKAAQNVEQSVGGLAWDFGNIPEGVVLGPTHNPAVEAGHCAAYLSRPPMKGGKSEILSISVRP